jgi:hypothetical protein
MEYPDPENQGERLYAPEDPVKEFFVAGCGFVVGDVSKEFPHGLILPGMENARATRNTT